MRIVQAANFVGPTSGGLRTAVEALARGYRDAGHERVLIAPGAGDSIRRTNTGLHITLRSPELPASGGYRMIVDCWRLRRLLDRLRPDRLEVSDRLTLRCLGPWARARGIRATVLAHERLDELLRLRLPPWLPRQRAADRWNAALAAAFDAVVCTTEWARQEFVRLGVRHAVRVPLGVDLTTFSPRRYAPALRQRLAPDGMPLVILASRLSTEKRPQLAVDTVDLLRRRGVPVHLVVAGDGPLRGALERRSQGLPVTFLRFIADRGTLAELLASADVALAPGPVETFGLSALEALACGTPIVTARTGALPELLAPQAGVAAYGHPAATAAGIRQVLTWDPQRRRRAARRRAEAFPWSNTVAQMLDVHRAA